MEKERAVEFSAKSIELINYYNVEGHDIQGGLEAFQQKNTYYVQNKCNSCRKLRVTLGESSDPVSASIKLAALPTVVLTIVCFACLGISAAQRN